MMQKIKRNIPLFFLFAAFAVLLPIAAFAANVNVDFLAKESSNPGEFVNNFYKFALGIAGAAAFAVIIWGAILYTSSAGNPSGQQNAKSWIMGAIWGVVLLLAAYLILYTINPNLVDLTSPELKKINLGPAPSAFASDLEGLRYEDDQRVREILTKGGIGAKEQCLPGLSVNCVNLNGMRQETINEILNIAARVGSPNIFITGGTEGGVHIIGLESHSTGYKFDLRLNDNLNSFIINRFEQIETRSDGATQYKSPFSGAIYALENDHWDILVK
jgi:hypothetical protein